MDEAQQSSLLFDRDVYDPTETSTPNTPEGVSVKAVQDGVLIEVDFTVDTAHLHPRFQAFIVYAKPIGSEASDGSGTEMGRFSDNDWTWQPPRGGYTGWFVSLTAISNTGRESGKSPWQQAIISTYYDDFSDYGGITTSNLDSLYWLVVDNFDSTSNASGPWLGSWFSVNNADIEVSTTYAIEGAGSLLVDDDGFGVFLASAQTIDFTDEGRFTDDDYVLISYYVVTSTSTNDIKFAFGSDAGGLKYATYGSLSDTVGRHYVAAKRSDLTVDSGFDWTAVYYLHLEYGGGGVVAWDDWRICKADPDDATTFNDTGPAWEFKQGAWHIYPGNRTGEPGYDFSLGQIQGGNLTNYFATRNNVRLPHGRVSAGVMLRGVNGRAGLLFRVTNTPAPLRVIVAEDITATDTVSV